MHIFKNYLLLRNTLLMVFLVIASLPAWASDLVNVMPVTDKILMVYLEDGHIDYYGSGQGISNNVTYYSPTVISEATKLSNYLLSSPDDSNYSTAKSPINLGRKSKGIEYNDEWQTVPYIFGHWIYIELPNAMQQGKSYTIALNNIVENKDEYTFLYDVNKLRSETVHVNMVGFPTSGPKYAYLSQWMGDFNAGVHQDGGLNLDSHAGNQFRLINYATGATAYTGTIALRKAKSFVESGNADFSPTYNYSNADVWQCDFSSFSTPGEYVVAVDGIGCSFPFVIGGDATKEPFYYAMKGLFWQRQGVAKENIDGSLIPRDHHPDDITWKWDNSWLPKDNHGDTNYNSSNAVVINGIYGYYHDAGDWDGYVSHARVPMALLLLYDLAPSSFYDGEIGNRYKLTDTGAWIDEGSNGLPDLLDEAVWLINYYKRARNTLKNNYGGTGGVPGYVGRDGVPNNNITAWQDTREWRLSGEDAIATFTYAGLAAWYATCLNEFHQLTGTGNHPDYSSWITEAEQAFAWGEANRQNTNLSSNANDEYRARGFAGAALYRATGNTTYQTAFQDFFNWEPYDDGEWANQNYIDVAMSVFAMIPSGHPGLNTTLLSDCQAKVISKADTHKVTNNQDNAFRMGIEKNQFIQLGGMTTPRLTLVPVAHLLTGDQKYVDVIHNSLNYALGGNQMNMTYLSGLGERSDRWIFSPNGWLTGDKNSMVYPNEPFVGYTSYYTATSYWFTQSAHSEYFSRQASYPYALNNPNKWPGGEQKFFNMYSIQGGEFTVHQQNNYMIYATGYRKVLDNPTGNAFRISAKPTTSLNLSDGQTVDQFNVSLSCTTSGNTRSVRYYYDWHFIGESFDASNNFQLDWEPTVPPQTTILITAVAVDEHGRIGEPSANGDKSVTIGGTFINTTGVSVSPTNTNLTLGRRLQLDATVTPSNASIKDVSWSSLNPSIATVDDYGKVTAVGIGTATIRVTTDNGGHTADATITVTDLDCSTGLNNASFESGLTGWTTNSGTPTISTDAVDGTQSAQLSGGGSGVEQQITQSIPEGTSVLLKFNAKVNATAGWTGVGIDFKDASGTTITSYNIQITATSWQQFLISETAPANTEKVNIWFYAQSDVLNVDAFCLDIEDTTPTGGPNPSVNITSPTSGQTFLLGETISIQAVASDSDGSIAQVTFWRVVGGQWNWLKNDTSAPYNYSASNFPLGTCKIVARATDNDGNVSTDSEVTITVSELTTDYTQDSGTAGIVSMEAEGFSEKLNGTGSFSSMLWSENTDTNASGGAYMVVPSAGNTNSAGTQNGPVLNFDIEFVKTGTHYVWVRQKSPSDSDNSIIPAFDGTSLADWNMPVSSSSWVWSKASATFNVSTTGAHTFSIYMREDATPIDKIVLTTSSSYTPSGTGPTTSSNARVTAALDNFDETANDYELTIYPNPATNSIKLLRGNSEPIDVSIIDLTGKVVFKQEQVKLKVDVNLPSGIYILKAQNSAVEYNKKLIIK
ncbi:Ig-like domain-containing protein [Limibacter armeniacum]|uniref:Ig-like domain-containing protein n=1 Tax=Limibacter armeniacum TaxID=466084 RepID=UPI002FE5D1DC